MLAKLQPHQVSPRNREGGHQVSLPVALCGTIGFNPSLGGGGAFGAGWIAPLRQKIGEQSFRNIGILQITQQILHPGHLLDERRGLVAEQVAEKFQGIAQSLTLDPQGMISGQHGTRQDALVGTYRFVTR